DAILARADRHATRWAEATLASCDVAPAERNAVAGCLDADFATFTAVLGAADRDTLDAAGVLVAIAELPAPQHCINGAAIPSRTPEVGERLRTARVHQYLDRIDALADDVAFLE